MADRRMFSKNVIDSDLFLDMPLSTQALYFHLAMRADDDGFVNNPKKIARMIGADEDSMRLLIAKSFLIPFENGLVVIRHWKIHNYIRKDLYKATIYTEEKSELIVDETEKYRTRNEVVTDTARTRNEVVTNPSLRIGKDNKDNKVNKDRLIDMPADTSADTPKPQKHKFGEYHHVLLTDAEYEKLLSDYGQEVTEKYIKKVDEYCEQSGKRYKNYNLAIRNTFMSRDGIVPKAQKRDIFSLPEDELTEQEKIIKRLTC